MPDRKTPMKDGELIVLLVATAVAIGAGKMVAVNASGYAIEAADAAGQKVMGRAETAVDNASGANGAISVNVRRKKAFKYKNSGTNAVAVAHIGTNIYVKDSETVSSAGGTNNIVAGKCLGVDADGVWVEIG